MNTEHLDGSRFHTVAVWFNIVLTLHYNNVIYKESHVYSSNTNYNHFATKLNSIKNHSLQNSLFIGCLAIHGLVIHSIIF